MMLYYTNYSDLYCKLCYRAHNGNIIHNSVIYVQYVNHQGTLCGIMHIIYHPQLFYIHFTDKITLIPIIKLT